MNVEDIVLDLWPDDLEGCISVSSARLVLEMQEDRLQSDLHDLQLGARARIEGLDEDIAAMAMKLQRTRAALEKLNRA